MGLTKKALSQRCSAELSVVVSVPKKEALIFNRLAACRKLFSKETLLPIQVNSKFKDADLRDRDSAIFPPLYRHYPIITLDCRRVSRRHSLLYDIGLCRTFNLQNTISCRLLFFAVPGLLRRHAFGEAAQHEAAMITI